MNSFMINHGNLLDHHNDHMIDSLCLLIVCVAHTHKQNPLCVANQLLRVSLKKATM